MPTAAPECVSIGEADGRILAEGVRARIDLPIFDTSSMDGYALRSSEVTRASKEAPTRLKIIGRVAAGERWTGKIAENTCASVYRLPIARRSGCSGHAGGHESRCR